jgi:hypothetical protein
MKYPMFYRDCCRRSVSLFYNLPLQVGVPLTVIYHPTKF